MGKVLVGVIVLLASVMLADSLTCKKCGFGLSSFCFFFSSTQTCTANNSVCANTVTTFSSVPSFGGFVFSNCLANSTSCGTTNTMPLVSTYNYTISVSCCSTNNCNTVNAAPSAKMSLGAAVSAAALASLLGRML